MDGTEFRWIVWNFRDINRLRDRQEPTLYTFLDEIEKTQVLC